MTINRRHVCIFLKVSHLFFSFYFSWELNFLFKDDCPLSKWFGKWFQTTDEARTSKQKLHWHLPVFWHWPLGWGWHDPTPGPALALSLFKTLVPLEGGGAAACTHVRWHQLKSDCGWSDSIVLTGWDFSGANLLKSAVVKPGTGWSNLWPAVHVTEQDVMWGPVLFSIWSI